MTITDTHRAPLAPQAAQAERVATGLLAELGRAPVADITPAPFAGRNHTWIMTLADGEKVFAKLLADPHSAPESLARSRHFADFCRRHPGNSPATAPLLTSCTDPALLLFDFCPGTSLAHLVVDEQVPNHFPALAGQVLAGLHAAPATGLTPTTITSPPLEMLQVGVPVERYVDFTLAELHFWAALQSDGPLLKAIGDMRREEQSHQNAPIHADLRLDQFHLNDGQLRLLDWECFGMGDRARDLGMLAGEWIYRAVLDTVTARGNAGAPPETFDEQGATDHIAARLAQAVPQIRQMWSAYQANATGTDPALAVRATAQLGWHLVDRALARAATVSRLSGIERAAAGIGRKALLAPADFCTAIGFEGN